MKSTTDPMALSPRFRDPWMNAVGAGTESKPAHLRDFPSFDAASLVHISQLESFQVGTGASIYTQSLLPAILEARYEVILVTCFWAKSSTRTALKEALEKVVALRRELIAREHALGPDEEALPPLRIHICFSSRSLFQKIFHTSSRDGYTYPPSAWTTKLGLPGPEVLEAGRIDLQVKSLFFLPFSVMHPKFLIVDRRRAWLPSCNISWEAWLEGCVEITGDAIGGLLRFYRSVWDATLEEDLGTQSATDRHLNPGRVGLTTVQSPASRFATLGGISVPTVLLPSAHHRNPMLRPFPWQRSPSPPPTPLNCAILRLLEMAETSVHMQTPNLTSEAVISALLQTLDRGVDVTIVTSKGMMLLEQIVTAGTTTAICLRSLVRRYQKMANHRSQKGTARNYNDLDGFIDVEAQAHRLGSLTISYFHSHPEFGAKGITQEPVHSHLKLTIVDEQFTVLGSGNMDRASWFTSQELGVLFQSSECAVTVQTAVNEVLDGRLQCIFDSKPSEQ